jgi:cytochrome c-type biogenesis protein CcmH/NrfF
MKPGERGRGAGVLALAALLVCATPRADATPVPAWRPGGAEPAAQDTVAPRFPVGVETAASRIFNSTMSPFCPGLLLSNCPSPQAGVLRDTIRAWLAAGVPADSIRAVLLAAYGDEVRAMPPASGFGLLAWLVPGAALVVGAVGVGWWLRRATRRAAPPGPPAPALGPDQTARLERELKRL